MAPRHEDRSRPLQDIGLSEERRRSVRARLAPFELVDETAAIVIAIPIASTSPSGTTGWTVIVAVRSTTNDIVQSIAVDIRASRIPRGIGVDAVWATFEVGALAVAVEIMRPP